MLQPELLAPAGNWECARAAIANGADAIFFGLPKFNARLRADNFSHSDLPELMEWLHRHSARGYVTMNTLIFTNELDAAIEQLRYLDSSGVDGVIVQDIGLASLVHQVAPNLRLHASTQMTITSPEGMQWANSRLRLDRAVLARELSVEDIRKITTTQPVPIEVFVHGALCVAYSGQCLTSESLGQRSANRGECAQACRLPYQLVVNGQTRELGEQRYLLSPQDLAAVDLVPDLIAAGVSSFKIEGRLKSPEYVAAVTRVYRKAIDAEIARLAGTPAAPEAQVSPEDRYSLEMTFSRGLTTGWLAGSNHPYLTHGRYGKKRGAFLGVIARCGQGWIELENPPAIPVQPEDGVVFDAGEDRNEEQGGRVWSSRDNSSRLEFHPRFTRIDWRRIYPGMRLWKTDDPHLNARIRKTWKSGRSTAPRQQRLDLILSGAAGQPLVIESPNWPGLRAASQSPLQPALNRPLDAPALRRQLGRLGDSPYELGNLDFSRLDLDTAPGLMLPVSEINQLRRDFLAAIASSSRVPTPPRPEICLDFRPAIAPPARQPELRLLCRDANQVAAALEIGQKFFYLDYEDPRRFAESVDMIRQAPGTTVFLATPRIQKPRETGLFTQIERCRPDGVLIRNLGALAHFENSGLRLAGDFSLNVANPLTARFILKNSPLEHLTISYDLNSTQVLDLLRATSPDWFELTLHQHMPLFHMEHCVFCAFLSSGKDFRDCGRPCEQYRVELRDRVGQLHRLMADVGCRNTLYNGRAQTGARFYDAFRQTGLYRYRVELLAETPAQTRDIVSAYRQLLSGATGGSRLWQTLGALEQLGVTEGTLIR